MGVKGEETRSRLIAATRALIEARGYFGTGLNQVLAESGAPRGSLYFHFPAGKDQLVAAALTESGQEVGDLIASLGADRLSALEIVRRLLDVFAERMEASDYDKGCPLATVALEVAGGNEVLRGVCAEAYGRWQQALADCLTAEGHSAASAEARASAVLAQVEGALLLARVQRSRLPLEQAARAAELLLAE
ncbi:TetR/AcrR family transcriptional regulator [Streptomyces sp. TRM68416]|uniref:TetR/AcrR family transcriptional regulator n=1 Tax=Streptomyces sp. TRM68416 TaxID=2758412 RepID=UPI001661C30A|nr:TetR/AcrR family transcriptional regulator [Streptomyces sp. TRM68416]MBD0843401.1 TetR/AcrR family transcriptional regulator [Streptomyces sp. TRM68416]